jgi:hypothetical protein
MANLDLLCGPPISRLKLGKTPIKRVCALQGVPLSSLWIFDTKLSDRSPLNGMHLTYLHPEPEPRPLGAAPHATERREASTLL